MGAYGWPGDEARVETLRMIVRGSPTCSTTARQGTARDDASTRWPAASAGSPAFAVSADRLVGVQPQLPVVADDHGEPVPLPLAPAVGVAVLELPGGGERTLVHLQPAEPDLV